MAKNLNALRDLGYSPEKGSATITPEKTNSMLVIDKAIDGLSGIV